ncbi:Aminoglycoside phosphotransferase [Penicillium italicum]|uniref:Aminoglycoside phosphotransferase n=1 Tax=Penicillium italicum TaxID=40296 RepID=A0A0A2KQQ4_PENIT|nr:Aminoglycoside phosphotransferase [Penicillium italicum]
MEVRMRYDDTAWQTSDKVADAWALYILNLDTFEKIGNFLLKHHQASDPIEFTILQTGAFNTALQMKFERTRTAVIRFPLPGATMFPEEKVCNEVSTMRFIGDKTTIPVPFIIHSGGKKESPSELGPFIIMEYIDHHANMIEILKKPGRPNEERVTLDPNISHTRLKALYGELARVLFSLSGLSQNKIGSLFQVDDFAWEVSRRPLSLHMNELVRLGTLPQSKLPATTFDTASSYFEALAELHISHLTSQRNDAVDSADDCRRKFVARFLFRKIVRDQNLKSQWISFENGPFPIWCDDFRPGNVLVDVDLNIAGVVDWEFTYTAPVEFTQAPPWWLLLEKPEYWPKGLDDWCIEYEKRLQTFLEAMIDCEEEAIRKEQLVGSQRLSSAMRRSWESGDFWIMYAARNNFAFDAIYWQKIDQRFFGPTTSECVGVCDIWKERLHLLEPEEQEFMQKHVDLKLKEMATGEVLAWDPDEYTLEFMRLLARTNDQPLS